MFLRIIFVLLFPVSIFAQHSKNVHSTSGKAIEFLNSLQEEQKKKVVFPFDEINRYNWHFVPATMSPRDGLSMKDLDDGQKEKLNELLHAFLSDKGYDKTKGIMSLEYVLKVLEPTNDNRIPENYFIGIYGDPSHDKVLGWKFGGHHIALNFTIVDDKIAFAPFFFGANPGTVRQGPQKGYRALKDEEDYGFELVNMLDQQHKEKAIFTLTAFADNVTTNVPQVSPLEDVGIMAKELTVEQKIVLNKLIATYLNAMPKKIAALRQSRIVKENFDGIRFGWGGSTKIGEPHYYRVQGKSFLIEFDNTQNEANHIHTVWRDFNGGDYGLDLIKEHYQKNEHHH